MFPDGRELIQCCMKSTDAGREVGMAQFKCEHTARFPFLFLEITNTSNDALSRLCTISINGLLCFQSSKKPWRIEDRWAR